jgi:hypothetical protein
VSYVYHALVAALCIAASYGLNLHQRPSFERPHAASEYSEQRGSLSLKVGGETRELPLMGMHIALQNVPRLDRVYKLRELEVRAVGPLEQQAQIELYVDLDQLGLDPSDATRDPRPLAQREQPVLRSGRFGAHRSLLALQGEKPRPVISGSLLFTEVELAEAGDKPQYHAAGRIELQVASEHGVEMVTGRLEGALAWDPP